MRTSIKAKQQETTEVRVFSSSAATLLVLFYGRTLVLYNFLIGKNLKKKRNLLRRMTTFIISKKQKIMDLKTWEKIKIFISSMKTKIYGSQEKPAKKLL